MQNVGRESPQMAVGMVVLVGLLQEGFAAPETLLVHHLKVSVVPVIGIFNNELFLGIIASKQFNFSFAVFNLITFSIQISQIAFIHTQYIVECGKIFFGHLPGNVVHGDVMLPHATLPTVVRGVPHFIGGRGCTVYPPVV